MTTCLTQTIVNLQPDMAGLQKRSRTKAAARYICFSISAFAVLPFIREMLFEINVFLSHSKPGSMALHDVLFEPGNSSRDISPDFFLLVDNTRVAISRDLSTRDTLEGPGEKGLWVR